MNKNVPRGTFFCITYYVPRGTLKYILKKAGRNDNINSCNRHIVTWSG